MPKMMILFVLILLLMVGGLWLMQEKIYQILVTQHVNERFPAFEVKDLQGHTVRSSEFRNKVLVLDFWTIWCGACQETLPEFQNVYEEYREHPDVVFLAINTGRGGDSLEKVQAFIEKHPYTFPVVYDEGSKLSEQLAVKYQPTLLIIDQAGQLRLRHVGYLKTFENYRSLLHEHIQGVLKSGRGEGT